LIDVEDSERISAQHRAVLADRPQACRGTARPATAGANTPPFFMTVLATSYPDTQPYNLGKKMKAICITSRLDKAIRFVVLVLITLSIAPVLILGLTLSVWTPQGPWLMALSICAWLLLIVAAVILNVLSLPYHRVALYGILATIGIYFLSGFLFP